MPTLEWNGHSLYAVEGKRKRYIGTVIPNAFASTWSVLMRGDGLGTVNSEEEARQTLESHAEAKLGRRRGPAD